MGVGRDDALALAERKKTPVPEVPPGRCRPLRQVGCALTPVRLLRHRHAYSPHPADSFKNMSRSIQGTRSSRSILAPPSIATLCTTQPQHAGRHRRSYENSHTGSRRGPRLCLAIAGCGHLEMMRAKEVARPAPAEFGVGPRPSAGRHFVATLQPDEPLRPRRMQTVRMAIVDATGRPVERAIIELDGGMPQHGHGLPVGSSNLNTDRPAPC